MPTAKIEYLGDLRTAAVHVFSGNSIITDAPLDNHGKAEAFSPTDLVSSALVSCMFTVMGIVANRHGINLNGSFGSVQKIMADHPRRISRLEVELTVITPGLSEEQKSLLKNTALTCPVAKSLHPEIEQVIHIQFPNS